MPYAKTTWVNGVTPVDQTNQNHLETQYDEAITPILKTADQTVNDSAVLINDTHLLFPIGANEIWAFELFLIITDTPATSLGLKTVFAVPVGATGYRSTVSNSIEAVNRDHQAQAIETNISYVSQSSAIGFAIITGVVANGANAGNIQFQWAQTQAGAVDSTIKENSFLTAHKLA